MQSLAISLRRSAHSTASGDVDTDPAYESRVSLLWSINSCGGVPSKACAGHTPLYDMQRLDAIVASYTQSSGSGESPVEVACLWSFSAASLVMRMCDST